VTVAPWPELSVFAAYGHGFRAPSEGQLFRQGRAQNTMGLRPVKADNFEVGVRGLVAGRLSYDVAAYRMTKTDDILSLTNADGSTETVNAGSTLHRGVEVGVGAVLPLSLRLDAAFAWNEHLYEEWRPRAGVVFDDNEMEDAPRTISNVVLGWSPRGSAGPGVSLEWSHVGRYWMDAENTTRYPGHDVLNLRARMPVRRGVSVFGRVTNLTDARYAESAAYTVARGEEYAPGLPRALYLGVEVR
jgi:iron complex outermembrane recepter protein